MKIKKYSKDEVIKIVEKHKQINENKKRAEEARKFINGTVGMLEDFFQLNKYK